MPSLSSPGDHVLDTPLVPEDFTSVAYMAPRPVASQAKAEPGVRAGGARPPGALAPTAFQPEFTFASARPQTALRPQPSLRLWRSVSTALENS